MVSHSVVLVAVDSPRTPADGEDGARECELEFVKARICGIRFTPGRARIAANPYYEWIENGFEMYEALTEAGLSVIECFPTASWTQWAGKRGGQRRSRWSRSALYGLGLEGVPVRNNQDERDAIAAAVTARAHHEGQTQSFGDLVVPVATDMTKFANTR